jgi:tryptophanyl-tRNA synthetase
LESWARLQDDYECFFLIADYHVLTSDYEHPDRLRDNVLHVLLDWLAAGIDPKRSTILLQSAIPEHAELSLLLGMLVTVPRLERNPTYKEQLQALGLAGRPSLGLLAYPVLQAADILIYRADTVPVGEDQLPHIELSREVARRFNGLYGNTFPEPQPLLSETPRFPGTDGRMMHTSYGNTIPLSDAPEEIRDKVLNMITDPQRERRTDAGRPEVCPVHAYHQSFEPQIAKEIAGQCRQASIGCVEHKRMLAEYLVRRLEPHRRIREEMIGREQELLEILRQGSQHARMVARNTLAQVRVAMGIPELQMQPSKPVNGNGQEVPSLIGKVCC